MRPVVTVSCKKGNICLLQRRHADGQARRRAGKEMGGQGDGRARRWAGKEMGGQGDGQARRWTDKEMGGQGDGWGELRRSMNMQHSNNIGR
jgi:hypothetical protein